jgi:adenosylhomocysteine nucleosidase
MVWRSLVQTWLQNAAREKLREKLAETARAEFSGGVTAEGAPEAEVPPCQFGVVFALGVESGGLEDLLEGSVLYQGHAFTAYEGGLKGRRVVLIRSGPGRIAARKAAELLISGHRPEWVISAGFCGGLDPRLERFDIVMAEDLVDIEGRRVATGLKADPAAAAKHVHFGRLLTVDEVVRLPRDKRRLGERHQALAVDMESLGVAEACQEAKRRFLAVRIVSDPVDEELPPDIQRLLEQSSRSAQLGAAVGAIWNRPGSFKDMYRLRENALIASDRLAKYLVSMLDQLAPPPALK